MVFENKISWNTIITGGMILVGGLFTFAEIRTQNALQDARIEANRLWMQESMEHERTARKEALIAETSARREAQAEFRIRMDTDRAEMRQQFIKLNEKIDELIKQGK